MPDSSTPIVSATQVNTQPNRPLSVNTGLYDNAMDRAAMIRLYERRISNKVSLIVDGHQVRTDELIRNAENSAKGFQILQEAVDKELGNTFGQIHTTTSSSLIGLVSDQISYQYQKLEAALSGVFNVGKPDRRVSEAIVLGKPLINNLTLAEGWNNISNAERVRIAGVIRQGIAKGDNTAAIALAVRDNNVYNITRNQSRGLVITATTSVYAQADHEVYTANKSALLGWQYVAIMDSRTTSLCAHRNGTVYPIEDTIHLPPAHFYCRSHTVPVTKSYDQLNSIPSIGQIRDKNLEDVSASKIDQLDGIAHPEETYNDWLLRQPEEVQLKHIGDTTKLALFQSQQLTADGFLNPEGNSIGLKELRQMTDSGYAVPGDTRKFANAKDQLDALQLGAARPEDLYDSQKMQAALAEYYQLQVGSLDGTLSTLNYRGTLIGNKYATKKRVLTTPPREEQLKFNPITGKYDDARMYQPCPSVLENNLRLVDESDILKDEDKEFIHTFTDNLTDTMGVNHIAAITDNLRIVIGRSRSNQEPWVNLKAVLQGQIKFDVMNVSDFMETQLRKDQNLLNRLKQDNYIDPVLGVTQLQDLHDGFISNIYAKNNWEDSTAPKLAREMMRASAFGLPSESAFKAANLPFKVARRLTDSDIEQFFLRFANRLSLGDTPDRDQLAVSIGRDFYNSANYRGSRNEWYNTGVAILDNLQDKGYYQLETFGVQKRRMKSRLLFNRSLIQ
jgi:SPP1 gp7 family putative phage head morphogenesis protein